MKFPQKVKMTVAAPSNNMFDLSQRYIGTIDFGCLLPVNYRLTYPHEKYHVEPSFLVRCSPLVVPAIAGVKMVMDSFFVPYHTVFDCWEKFLTRESYTNSTGTSYKVTKVPYFGLGDIHQILLQSSMSTSTNVTITAMTLSDFDAKMRDHDLAVSPSTVYDFVSQVTYDGQGGITGYVLNRFTDLGKRVYNLFLSLGYPVRFGFERSQFTGTSPVNIGNYSSGFGNLSALPLLAYIKVYLDWYQSNQFTNDSALRKLFDKIRQNNYGIAIPLADLSQLVALPFNRCYNGDLFTSSWLTPNADTDVVSLAAPNDFSTTQLVNVNNANQGAGARGTTTPIIPAVSISMAARLQNFIDRWRIGGKRDVDRNLAEFGVKSKDVNYHRSNLLHSFASYLQVSDVMCNNSDPNQDVVLGEYGGKGLMAGRNGYNFECDDYGVMITIASLIPETGYPYGVSKDIQDVELFDFYTPEFDSVGVEAITMSQLTQSDSAINNPVSGSFTLESVFGYAPRYAHHKVGHDTLAGDFRIGSLSQGQDAWHLYRADYKDKLANNEYFRQIYNAPGSSPRTDGLMDDYDRIFALTDGKQDNFKLLAEFKISASRPMRTIADSLLPVYDGESHNEVNVGYNGVQL